LIIQKDNILHYKISYYSYNGVLGQGLVPTGYAAGEYRKVLLVLSGFSSAGAGKLIGPDGQEMDNEAFLSDLS
jgi:hypothetical protein